MVRNCRLSHWNHAHRNFVYSIRYHISAWAEEKWRPKPHQRHRVHKIHLFYHPCHRTKTNWKLHTMTLYPILNHVLTSHQKPSPTKTTLSTSPYFLCGWGNTSLTHPPHAFFSCHTIIMPSAQSRAMVLVCSYSPLTSCHTHTSTFHVRGQQ